MSLTRSTKGYIERIGDDTIVEASVSTAIVALVGGQPLPNLLPIKFYHPPAVALLYTEKTRHVYERLFQTIKQTTTVTARLVDPYNINTIEEELEQCLEPLKSNYQLLFNLTGGTKAMALAAYRVAERYQAEILYLESERKKSTAYRYQWYNGAFQHQGTEDVLANLSLTDMLNVHFGPDGWQVHGPSQREGGQFEAAIAAALCQHVDEVMVGVKSSDGQLDIDLVVRVGDQWGIIEAKTAKHGNKVTKLDGIKQLSTAGRRLGTYTQQFYVINGDINKTHQPLIDTLAINVITLPEYHPGDQQLTATDAQRLVNEVRRALGNE